MGVATVIRNNSIQEAEDKDVDIEIMSPTNLVGSHPNLVPFANNAQGARIFYASKFVNQVMPLKNPEAPLIQVNNPQEKRSFESIMGERMGARLWRSDKGGTVKSIDKDKITVTDDAGEDHDVDLYNDFEFNRKTQITNRPVVKVGDKVQPNQLLAASNYTDDNGTLSMGKNARVALIPYKGWSMDDAVVVSESFANRMTSQHSYESSIQKDTDTVFGKNHYASVFPTKFTTKQLENIGDDGIVKAGTVLHKGDPILLATRPKQINSNAEHLGKLGKLFRSIRSDAAEVWEHEYPGYVTDSINGKKNAKAFITAEVPLTLGDKLVTSRPGQKSIVSKIVPDEQMVRSMDGTPFEVLINPLALPSRINTATLFELAMGKVANKQGKPIVIDSFQKKGESRLDGALKMLADAGLKSTEQVYDPVTDKVLAQPVTTGMSYIYKLHHVVESKRSERGQGSYTADFQPAKGGGENAQAKRLGGLEVTALLSKGGYNTLREASTIRGTQNDEYWATIRQGYKPADPGVPFVFNKFLALLNGAGMETQNRGNGVLRLKLFTDDDLKSKGPRLVKNGGMIKGDSLDGIDDGLFDKNLVAQNGWGYIPLKEPMINPAAESIILNLLQIKEKDLRRVLAGEITLEEARQAK